MSLPTPLPALPLPLPDAVAQPLLRLTEGLDARALWWLSGYAAGLAARAPDAAPAAPVAAAEAAAPRLSIVYGSQTGNAQRVAEGLAAEAEAAGLTVRLARADAYPLRELAQERALLLVLSTQGDGDPSDDARGLYDHLFGRRAPRLEQLRYAVLGLGDSSYPQFCAVGMRLDARLAELGGRRLLPRADADLDIDAVALPWRAQALAAAGEALKPSATVTPLRPPAQARAAAATPVQAPPFAAELLANHTLVTVAAGRDIRHFELSLAGAELHYEPGDALAVRPRNDEALIDAVLAALKLDGDRAVTHGDATHALRDWLRAHRELTRLVKPFLAAHAARGDDAALHARLAGEHAALSDWMRRRQLIDLLREHPADWSADALIAALPPLAPRPYSIASSRKAVGDEAHLTVALLAHGVGDARRFGAASRFLAAAAEGDRVPVQLEANPRFRLPADPARDVIMIAAGTGIAPFRGFVQERSAVGAGGRHWLFFGNRRFRDDFLYQLEWQRARKDGRLQRIDLAFSRDRAARVYVQDRIREHGRALYDWLQGGAHLYVCGSIAMGKDVHRALREVFAAQRGGDIEAGEESLAELQQQGRYARDVY